MIFLQHEVFRKTSYQRNIISKKLEAGRELSRMGSKQDGIEARRENPKLDKNSNFGNMKFSMKPKDREIFTAKSDFRFEFIRNIKLI